MPRGHCCSQFIVLQKDPMVFTDVLKHHWPAGGRLVQQEMTRALRDWPLDVRSSGPPEDNISQAPSS